MAMARGEWTGGDGSWRCVCVCVYVRVIDRGEWMGGGDGSRR